MYDNVEYDEEYTKSNSDRDDYNIRVFRKPSTGDMFDITIECGATILTNGDAIDVEFKGSW